MFPVVLALFGIQVTVAGIAFALTGSAQIGALCAIVGILIEIAALAQSGTRPTGGGGPAG